MIKLEDVRGFMADTPTEGTFTVTPTRPSLRVHQSQHAQPSAAPAPYKEFSPAELTEEQCAELNRLAPLPNSLRILNETAWDD